MKKGSYRFIIRRTTEVLITVDDTSLFETGRLAWEANNAADLSSDYLTSIALRVERDERPDTPGARCKIDADDLVIAPVRTCRHCGCTDNYACSLSTGPCSWIAEDLCSNPFCVAARQAEAEKEGQNG